MKRAVIVLAALFLLLFAGCAKSDGFDAGETLSGEELEQLQKSLLEEKNQPATPPEKIECYYTASGSVYHKDRNCSFLKNAKEVLEGTIEEATVTRALRPCSRCAVEKTEEEGGRANDGEKNRVPHDCEKQKGVA